MCMNVQEEAIYCLQESVCVFAPCRKYNIVMLVLAPNDSIHNMPSSSQTATQIDFSAVYAMIGRDELRIMGCVYTSVVAVCILTRYIIITY